MYTCLWLEIWSITRAFSFRYLWDDTRYVGIRRPKTMLNSPTFAVLHRWQVELLKSLVGSLVKHTSFRSGKAWGRNSIHFTTLPLFSRVSTQLLVHFLRRWCIGDSDRKSNWWYQLRLCCVAGLPPFFCAGIGCDTHTNTHTHVGISTRSRLETSVA